MTDIEHLNRRTFLQSALSLPVGLKLYGDNQSDRRAFPQASTSAGETPFMFGASVYPELQTAEEWGRMLDEFKGAHMNIVRVAESSWGNIETEPGRYNFGWLREFLNGVAARGMKAILGTSTYIAPQWLAAEHPDILVQLLPGVRVDPMSRKAACLNHPLYRDACRRYIKAIGSEFKDHPAVVGWQLDNEIEAVVNRVCYNEACSRAWHDWLRRKYRTPEELNDRLDLVSWGMRVQTFEEIPQPRVSSEGAPPNVQLASTNESRRSLPALSLANLHFRRDVVLEFLIDQARTLRSAGVRQWITTDWNTVWTAVADDPLASKALNVAGLNYYQPTADNLDFWNDLSWHQDMHRSAYGKGHFITTENRFGPAAATFYLEADPSHDQFRMWGLQAAAFGSSGVLYWSGNRWRGGHWPYWGGLLDWSGKPEPDFGWAAEVGEFFSKWGPHLLENPVRASAVVLTDFDQRATLLVYPCDLQSRLTLPQTFEVLHRLGIGADSMNLQDAEDAKRLEKYELVVIPSAIGLEGVRLTEALEAYARSGGTVLITPFTAYQNWDGILRGDGFGANLVDVTGVVVQTIRKVKEPPRIEWTGESMNAPSVASWGFCEIMKLMPEATTIGTFKSDEAILNGRPAATMREVGAGKVIKLAFWPDENSRLGLFASLVRSQPSILKAPVPQGVQAIPRMDHSLFVVNSTGKSQELSLAKFTRDRIADVSLSGTITLRPYQVVWLE